MSTKLLEIQNLHKKYGENTVLKNISLDVHQGEVVVIIGPSGCGKSTMLRCINGLEGIEDNGQIKLNGENLVSKNTDWKKVRQQIGMVFQSYDLFPHMTVMQNIMLAPTKVQKLQKSDCMQLAEKLLTRVGLLDKKDAYPRELSGGQKQRVAIVRALMMNPQIMLFDEVTASLDPEMVREVLNVILELAKSGSTMLIVTHEMQFARAIADKIVFMDNGEIVEITPPETFFENPQSERAKKFINIFNYNNED